MSKLKTQIVMPPA